MLLAWDEAAGQRLAAPGLFHPLKGYRVIRGTLFRLSQQRTMRSVAAHNPIARKMALRFVAGETLAEAIPAVRAINGQGMTATLDHLGENVSSRREAVDATTSACELVRAIAAAGVQANASLKLTQLGLDLGTDLALDHMTRVLECAEPYGNFIRIDMEGAEYVDRTLEVFYQLLEHHRNVGVVIQSCLYRSQADVEQLLKIGARVRLVKGAYLEPPSVAFQRKEDVDSSYLRLMEALLLRGNYPAIATHDEAMIGAATQFVRRHAIAPDRYEFQMLYGIRRDLQLKLVADGYRMRVYVPYGTHWYPYLMRRMAERPANVMFVLANMAREARGS